MTYIDFFKKWLPQPTTPPKSPKQGTENCDPHKSCGGDKSCPSTKKCGGPGGNPIPPGIPPKTTENTRETGHPPYTPPPVPPHTGEPPPGPHIPPKTTESLAETGHCPPDKSCGTDKHCSTKSCSPVTQNISEGGLNAFETGLGPIDTPPPGNS